MEKANARSTSNEGERATAAGKANFQDEPTPGATQGSMDCPSAAPSAAAGIPLLGSVAGAGARLRGGDQLGMVKKHGITMLKKSRRGRVGSAMTPLPPLGTPNESPSSTCSASSSGSSLPSTPPRHGPAGAQPHSDVPGATADDKMTFNVLTIMGRTFQIRVLPTDSVRDVKRAIQKEAGINADAQVLVYQDKALVNDRALVSECGIRDGATIQLVVQMMGGPGAVGSAHHPLGGRQTFDAGTGIRPGGEGRGSRIGSGRARRRAGSGHSGDGRLRNAGDDGEDSREEVVLLLCKQDGEVYVLEVHLKDGGATGEASRRKCLASPSDSAACLELKAKREAEELIEMAVSGSSDVDVDVEVISEQEAVRLLREANINIEFELLDRTMRQFTKSGIQEDTSRQSTGAGGTEGEATCRDRSYGIDTDDLSFLRPISASSTISTNSLSTFLSLATTMTSTTNSSGLSSSSTPSISSAFSSRPISAFSISTISRPGSGSPASLRVFSSTPASASLSASPMPSRFPSFAPSANSTKSGRLNGDDLGGQAAALAVCERKDGAVPAEAAARKEVTARMVPYSNGLPLRGQRPATAICITRVRVSTPDRAAAVDRDWESCALAVHRRRPKSAGVVKSVPRPISPSLSDDEDKGTCGAVSPVEMPEKIPAAGQAAAAGAAGHAAVPPEGCVSAEVGQPASSWTRSARPLDGRLASACQRSLVLVARRSTSEAPVACVAAPSKDKAELPTTTARTSDDFSLQDFRTDTSSSCTLHSTISTVSVAALDEAGKALGVGAAEDAESKGCSAAGPRRRAPTTASATPEPKPKPKRSNPLSAGSAGRKRSDRWAGDGGKRHPAKPEADADAARKQGGFADCEFRQASRTGRAESGGGGETGQPASDAEPAHPQKGRPPSSAGRLKSKDRSRKSTAGAAGTGDNGAAPGKKPTTARARCAVCNRRLPLVAATFRCRCGKPFCSNHRYSDRHTCTYDYKAEGRIAIARENPCVVSKRRERS